MELYILPMLKDINLKREEVKERGLQLIIHMQTTSHALAKARVAKSGDGMVESSQFTSKEHFSSVELYLLAMGGS